MRKAGRSGQAGLDIADSQRSAEAGSTVAQSVLGICYLEGFDVEVSYDKAFRLLSAAAEKGAPRAVANLARMYAGGLGIEIDLNKAIRLYRVAAEAGEFLAQIELARICARGAGGRPKRKEAVRWYAAIAAFEGKVVGCDEEIREAKAYLSRRP